MYVNDFGKTLPYSDLLQPNTLWMGVLINYHAQVNQVRVCPSAPEKPPLNNNTTWGQQISRGFGGPVPRRRLTVAVMRSTAGFIPAIPTSTQPATSSSALSAKQAFRNRRRRRSLLIAFGWTSGPMRRTHPPVTSISARAALHPTPARLAALRLPGTAVAALPARPEIFRKVKNYLVRSICPSATVTSNFRHWKNSGISIGTPITSRHHPGHSDDGSGRDGLWSPSVSGFRFCFHVAELFCATPGSNRA